MSESSTPYAPMFELQRRSIDGGRQAVHWGVELTKRANRLSLDSVDATRSAQRASTEVSHTAMAATLDAMAAAMPGSEGPIQSLHEEMDGQYEAATETSDQLWDAFHDVMAENARAYEEFADRYLEMVDGATDDSLEALSSVESEMGAGPMRWTE